MGRYLSITNKWYRWGGREDAGEDGFLEELPFSFLLNIFLQIIPKDSPRARKRKWLCVQCYGVSNTGSEKGKISGL